jgi:hypothetical protein
MNLTLLRLAFLGMATCLSFAAQAQWTSTASRPERAQAKPECLTERSNNFKDIPLCDADTNGTPRVTAVPARTPTAHYVLHPHVPLDRRLPPYTPKESAAETEQQSRAAAIAEPIVAPVPPPVAVAPALAAPAMTARPAAAAPVAAPAPSAQDLLDAASFPPEVEDTQGLGRFRVVVGQSLRQAWESFGASLRVKTQWAVPDMAAQGNVDIAAISVEDLGQRLVLGAGLAGQELRLQVYHDNTGRLQAARIVSNSP